MTMRAIVIEQPRAVALKDVEMPEPGPGEVRVRSVLAGVCRTDIDILTGALDARWVRFPVVPGHEWSGVVELRYLGGLTIDETAETLGVSHGTVESDWAMAKAWLRSELSSTR